MDLNPQKAAAYKDILLYPSKYGLKFRSITTCFQRSESLTSCRQLFLEMKGEEAPMLQEAYFTIAMEEAFGLPEGRDEAGAPGYFLGYRPFRYNAVKPEQATLAGVS